jgi:hypothetical protein
MVNDLASSDALSMSYSGCIVLLAAVQSSSESGDQAFGLHLNGHGAAHAGGKV